LRVLAIYLAAVNVLAYGVYWLDKRRAARGSRRIPERELLLWAAAGGSLGAFLSMRAHAHKTRKRSFRLSFYGIIALQLALAYFLLTADGQ